MELNVALVGAIVAVISSLIAELFSGWKDFAYKRQTMLGINFLIPIAIWLLVCLANLPLPIAGVVCTTMGVLNAMGIGVMAALGNQGIYKLFTNPVIAQPRRG